MSISASPYEDNNGNWHLQIQISGDGQEKFYLKSGFSSEDEVKNFIKEYWDTINSNRDKSGDDIVNGHQKIKVIEESLRKSLKRLLNEE